MKKLNAHIAAALLVLIVPSLGCLLGGPGFDPFPDVDTDTDKPRTDTQDGEVPDVTHTTPEEIEDPTPSYDPLSHDNRDNPNSADYRGMFRLSLTDDISAQLDSERLGEASYSYIAQDATGSEPHCLIALIDRRPDATGTQGYLLLRYVAPDCLPQGKLNIWDREDRGRPEDAHVILGALRLERELGDDFNEWELEGPMGQLEIVAHQDGRLRGEFSLGLTKLSRDGEPFKEALVSASGNFEAVWMPVEPGQRAPR